MGSLIHIAEVAILLFIAYAVGWLVGYALHRLVARPATTAVVEPARSSPAVSAQPDDALVRAPVVSPVSASAPMHVHAKVTQIEPATAIAVPDGMVLAEARSIDVPKVPPAPVSAMESLKSLTNAVPLAPIELRPIGPVQPAAAAEAITPVDVEAVPDTAIVTPIVTDEAAITPIVAEVEPKPAIATPRATEEPPEAATSVPNIFEPPLAPPEPSQEPDVVPEPVSAETASAPEPMPAVAEPGPLAAVTSPEPQPSAPLAMPSSRAGVAWDGAIKGREAPAFERVAEVGATTEPEDGQGTRSPSAGLDVSLLESLADELDVDEPALPIAELNEMAGIAESIAPPIDDHTTEPALSAVTEAAAPADAFAELPAPPAEADSLAAATVVDVVPPTIEPVPPPPPTPPRQFDEDAAMRAIEGGWSRRQTRAMSDAYELADVSAAVSAAQVAVEQVLAAKGIDATEQGARAQASFGKPKGLPHPRDHQRDNLKQINGLGPLDESALNNLGIYHFDQIAAWDQKEVLWLENHAFARGRIGREDWQGQARSLMVDSEAARRIGG